MALKWTADEVAKLSDVQRAAVIDAAAAMMFVDGAQAAEMDWMRRFFLAGAWAQVSPAWIDQRLSGATARLRAGLAPIVEACAAAIATPGDREILIAVLASMMGADGKASPAELDLLGVFARALGVSGERATAIAELAGGAGIHRAASRGDLATMTRLLDAGASVDARDPNQWTPLHVAVACGQFDAIALLLARGADTEAHHDQQLTPIYCACNKPLARAVELLLAARANPDAHGPAGLRPLMLATKFRQAGVVDALLRGGASVNAADDAGRTALHVAAVAGDPAIAVRLLDANASVEPCDRERLTPLHLATSAHPSVAVALIARGANVNARAAIDVTPLHLAARAGSTSIVRLLLDAGAEVDPRNAQGGTPVFQASIHRRADCVALLVSRGAVLDPSTAGKAKQMTIETVPHRPRAPIAAPIDAAHAIAAYFADRMHGIPVLRAFAEHATWRRLAARARPDAPLTAPDGKRVVLLFTSDALVADFIAKSPWLPPGVGAFTVRGADVFADLPRDLDVLGIDHQPAAPDRSLFYGADQLDVVRRVGRAILLEAALAGSAPLALDVVARAAAYAPYVVAAWPDQLEHRSRLIGIRMEDGRILVPIHTLPDAFAAFEATIPTGNSVDTPASIFDIGTLPVDGAIINPCGPGPTRVLSVEECEWISHR